MPSRVTPGPVQSDVSIREAVCVHTSKIYDSCKDKDCLENMRVYLTANSQAAVDNGLNVRARSAELLWASPAVEPVSFNRGYYTVDTRFYYKIRADVCMSSGYCSSAVRAQPRYSPPTWGAAAWTGTSSRARTSPGPLWR